jgi:hypothetical protein
MFLLEKIMYYQSNLIIQITRTSENTNQTINKTHF